ncbi:MAG TPA: HD domain-containing protein [Elusimicrobiales bacterium]|nr:HD domain-containing protein [Elusimicrobiales bacterium]
MRHGSSQKKQKLELAAQNAFAQAFYYALRAHESQFRKGTGRPYIEHPLRVAAVLMELGAATEVVTAGFLHDVIEDTGKGQAEIKALFGTRVAALVGSVSEDKHLSWEERKRRTVAFIKRARPQAVLLEFADKLDNLRSIRADYERSGEEMWGRFQRPIEAQEWYYRSLLAAFSFRLKQKHYRIYVREMKELVSRIFG